MIQEWRGKKVLILGLGQYPKGSGVVAALFFAKAGANVLVSDFYYKPAMDANVRALKKFKDVRFIFKKHPISEVRTADLVVKHQRIRMNEPEVIEAKKRNVPIETAESLFLKLCPCPVVGITGTRGKSTTTALVAEMLKGSKKRVWLGGNNLLSPLSFVHQVKKNDIVVLELSSFQLEGTGEAGISPHVACVTNVLRDHLNTYNGMDDYAEAKAQIFRHQQLEDVVILNSDDAYGREWMKEAPGRVVAFSKKQKLPSTLKLRGEHNRMNALAAVQTARAAGASEASIRKALKTFSGLPDRQEVIALKNGVTYVNDTTATTPDGAIAAIRTFSGKNSTLRIIIGGADKELEFDDLARELKKAKADVIVLPGTAHKKLIKELKSKRVVYRDVPSLKEAVRVVSSEAEKGDVILLSPGCASFGLFKNEFDRGMQFRRLVKR